MAGMTVNPANRNQLAGMAVFCEILGTVLYLYGWRALRIRWMISAMPTSKARSVAMGLAELKGKAKPLGPEAHPSPVRGVPCVWSHVVAQEHKKEGKNESTRILVDREVREPFILEDNTGRVAVLPAGADIKGVMLTDMRITRGEGLPPDILQFCDMNGIPVRTLNMWSGIHYTLKEDAVLADADIYVLGQATPSRESQADRRRRNIADRLKAWLKDPAKKGELDANKDGIIQQEEWEAAQVRAQDEVLKEDLGQVEEAASPLPPVAIRRPDMGFFLISSGTEKEALDAQGNPAIMIPLGLGFTALGVYITPPDSWASWSYWVAVVVMVFGSFYGGIRNILGKRN